VKRFDWQDAVQTETTPATPDYALPFAVAVAVAMVAPDQPCASVDERRSAFAIQALYLVEEVAAAVRVNALPEQRQVLREVRRPIALNLGRLGLGDQMREQEGTQWFLNFTGARDAFRANLHLISDPNVAAAMSELIEHAKKLRTATSARGDAE
jgi:hypothetical protein